MYSKHVDAHTLLKGSTAEIHNRLHHVPLLEKISQGNFNREDYCVYLSINHSFYKNLESHFADVNLIRFEEEMSFTPWIEQDINALSQNFALNVASFSDLPNNFSTYVGFGYVKYGSMTGSLVLLSKVTKTKCIDASSLNFLNQCAQNRDRIWPRFLEFITRHRDSIEIDVAIESAQFCFNLMYQYASGDEYGRPNSCRN